MKIALAAAFVVLLVIVLVLVWRSAGGAKATYGDPASAAAGAASGAAVTGVLGWITGHTNDASGGGS